ncbi:saccharopine dehydrogenase family protein [Bradyrhizobium archetypum]|uniref:Saccharopine dehydrogenase n=1 Tax=Bradyrhizobium archetypum TaxID=2721160 RepID=A0A7Y4HAA9_9BRAD|nr:saccharopine dehydrogenase NADP-binding domain-containing protein [Bradyrhizobium archetypum]NOJ50568.1 saccharopine dehydrogenase [Bradyrhizobium archetypum]
MKREFDLIVYGATGYTGRLIAEYLATSYRGDDAPAWAIAGRSTDKLQKVRADIGAPDDLPLIKADADERASLRSMCERAAVIITTVGPYQLHGPGLVAACAATGTAYVDLCGEPAWMRRMIDAHHEEAKRTGARIVFSCGFDSIPFDLGVLTLQEKAREKFGRPAQRVKARLRKVKGGMSGGTAASAQATLAAAARDPALIGLLTDPFALTPGFTGPSQPSGLIPEYDRHMNAWLVPFPMAPVNTKNVHRTNFLLGHPYGRDFVYDEMMVAPGLGEIAGVTTETFATVFSLFRTGGLKPGAGPTREEREKGFYDILFLGELPDGGRVETVVRGDRDPGYGSTSKMIAESALCVVRDVQGEGGIWTPGALMGPGLRKRLTERAGLTFSAR